MALAITRPGDDSLADMSTFHGSETTTVITPTSTTVFTATSTVPTVTVSTSAIAHTSAEGAHHHDGTASSRFLSRLEGLSLNVKQLRYDWDAPDQHQEFIVFCKQLTSWFNLRSIRNFQACDAILCCLGRKDMPFLMNA